MLLILISLFANVLIIEADAIGDGLQRLLGRSDVWIRGMLYMTRFRFIRTPWGEARVHIICQSDDVRQLHDHPFDFTSLILWGGYWEHLKGGHRCWRRPLAIVRRKAETQHRIELDTHMDDKPRTAITLVFTGPRRRVWGFQTEQGWVDHETFTHQMRTDIRRDEFAAESSI